MLQYCFRSYVRAYETQSHAHKIAKEGNVGREVGRYTTQRGPEGGSEVEKGRRVQPGRLERSSQCLKEMRWVMSPELREECASKRIDCVTAESLNKMETENYHLTLSIWRSLGTLTEVLGWPKVCFFP